MVYELVADTATDVPAWMEGTLKKWWVAGTVDGVYCETSALAIAATQALAAQNRTDMEVFCAEADAALRSAMEAYPALLVAAVGLDEAAFAEACASALQTLLSGGVPASRVLGPTLFLKKE